MNCELTFKKSANPSVQLVHADRRLIGTVRKTERWTVRGTSVKWESYRKGVDERGNRRIMDNGIEIEVWFAFTRDSEEVEFLRYLLAAQIARKFVHPTDKGIPWAELVAIREGADTITIIGKLKWLGAIGFNTQAGNAYWGVSDFGQEILDRLEKQPKITVTRNECY